MRAVLLSVIVSFLLSAAYADDIVLPTLGSEGLLPKEISLVSPVVLGEVDGKHGVILVPTDRFLSAPKWEPGKELPLSLNDAVNLSLIALADKSKIKLSTDDLDNIALRRNPNMGFGSNLYYHVVFWPRDEIFKFNYKAKRHVIVLLDGSVYLPEYLPLPEHEPRLKARCPARIDNTGKVVWLCER